MLELEQPAVEHAEQFFSLLQPLSQSANLSLECLHSGTVNELGLVKHLHLVGRSALAPGQEWVASWKSFINGSVWRFTVCWRDSECTR